MKTSIDKIKGWVRVLPFCLFALLPLLVSCSEADDTVEEYADWDEKNAEWFVAKYADVQSKIAGGDTSWRVIRSFAKGDTMLVKSPADYIVVQVVDSLASPVDEHPIYTDSVAVHYRGWLIPSASYAGGYQFDSSYMGTFDAAIASPAEFAVKSLVPGFSTALMYMRRGDHWRVSIPYQLAYGSSANGSIPAYSNLIFEIRLVDFWH